jgi:hypothetical protein
MNYKMYLLALNWLILGILFLTSPSLVYAQSANAVLSKEAMLEDLRLFREIREAANSGMYEYRSREEIDSTYRWAEKQITEASTILDLYIILSELTDFEGSLHNDTGLPDDLSSEFRNESTGYFPYPLIQLEGKSVMNLDSTPIPLGSEIISIDGRRSTELVLSFHKFYTTDGYNLTGKKSGIDVYFPIYYRYLNGPRDTFTVDYLPHGEQDIKTVRIPSTGYRDYSRNYRIRHSKYLDAAGSKGSTYNLNNRTYSFEKIDDRAGLLTINSFLIGWNEEDKRHKAYVRFLDSVFTAVAQEGIENMIVDVRQNGGGTDPNDMVTYSFLSDRPFVENTEAWVSATRIPYWKHLDADVFFLIRPIAKMIFQRQLRKEFPIERNGRFYADDTSQDHQIRQPRSNAFTGRVYLLIGGNVASAGSMFAAMAAGNSNTKTVGEETMGGYWKHNGHQPVTYRLPNSGITTTFSIVNLVQDVVEDPKQPRGRGVLPDYPVRQTVGDFLERRDTQMEYVLRLVQAPK